VTFEELRGDFRSELEDPSAWTLQRIIVLTQASQFAAEEKVRLWSRTVAEETDTPVGTPLRLPPLLRPGRLPFHWSLTWEEANALDGEDREICFGREGGEYHKTVARSLILFLFPEAGSNGLYVCEKARIFTAASNVWLHNPPRAEALLWVLDKEYPGTREGNGRGWVNPHSKEFTIYTVLFPPPIVPVR